MKSKLKKIVVLVIGLLIAVVPNNLFNINSEFKTELSIPRQSASLSFIHVDNNWSDTAAAYGWCSGDGSWSKPYTIKNVTIDAISSPIGSGILINNSLDAHFIIRNCTIINANGASGYLNYGGGIKLINCSRGVIYNNTCADGGTNGCGILAYGASFNITISDNIVKNNGMHGILAADSSNNLSITYNNVRDTTNHGIYLFNGCFNNTIYNNNATNNGDFGIRIYSNCDNNTIIGNNASGNSDGIFLYFANNNTIQGNIANDNKDEGIDLNQGCDYNRVLGNIANNNNKVSGNGEGIQIYSGSDFNIISGNNVSNNDNGIRLHTNCDNNTIMNNNASNNGAAGIYLNTGSEYNNITENIVNNNNQIGIELSNTDNNTIKNNTINRNELGILLDLSNNNTVTENTLMNNGFCIREFNSLDNIIEDNYCTPPTLSEPIFINGTATGAGAHNWTWAVSQSWCSGSGTWSDPYVIDNININGFGVENCIEIINSNSFLIIQNCNLYNSVDYGIYLENVNNSRLINNNCTDSNTYGIYLKNDCNNNTISGNIASNNDYAGIYLIDYCDNNTISGNTVNDNNVVGIYLTDDCDYNKITGNVANGNDYSGISFDGCDDNFIIGNTINDNNAGISMSNACEKNIISNNTVNDNYNDGLYIGSLCNDNNILGNTINNNGGNGVYLDECNNTDIIGNIVNENGQEGIYLYAYCDYNTISNNFINGSEGDGIFLEYHCGYNAIYDNIVSYNAENGIVMYDYASNNTISNNFVSYNGFKGIEIIDDSDNNTLTENILYNNTIGVFIEFCENNSIYENFFLKNQKHTIDDGTDNKWNSTTIGNYWDNYTETHPNLAIDADDNGIGDVPYNISLTPLIQDHLPIFDDESPIIYIDSPAPGDIFGSVSPSFNVRITEDYLYEMWYTLDGGLHNYTFTVNGSIDQDAWDAMPEGSITLTFYARDKPGNIGSAEVLITKDYEVPTVYINSPDPGDIFGSDAPSFNVRITDDYLHEIWYTLDGGLTTHPFTDNGTIDQDAWDAVPEGNVTLTFHAIDDLGHIGSAGVNITKDYETPIVYINSPDLDDIFGTDAPSFNVRITDDYLDTMWYTLDGGLNNYTFTANDTIDQSAWNAVADGAVILKFYANDTLSHVGSAEVSIIKDATAPIIIINSPAEGDRFGKNAPLFNITITEINLDAIWYSFDGGVTTHAITDDTIFNQTAWTALSQGDVTITFYARDLAGNEASESVTIIKSVPSGLDPGVIITIVVISIVGGVAVIAGVYVFMKKRAAPA